MKNVLGWSEEQIEENFRCLIKDKQYVAVANYFSDLVSPDNPPVDIKSPITLKSDVDRKEKALTSGPSNGNDEEQ